MTNTRFTIMIGVVLAIGIAGFTLTQKEKVVEVDVPVVEVPVTEIPTMVFQSVIAEPATAGIVNPNDVFLDYPQTTDTGVIDQGSDIGFALLGVDMETLDYIPLRMDVDGYIMCKDVNKTIFKLVLKDDVTDKSPEELIELIREKKGE